MWASLRSFLALFRFPVCCSCSPTQPVRVFEITYGHIDEVSLNMVLVRRPWFDLSVVRGDVVWISEDRLPAIGCGSKLLLERFLTNHGLRMRPLHYWAKFLSRGLRKSCRGLLLYMTRIVFFAACVVSRVCMHPGSAIFTHFNACMQVDVRSQSM